MHSIGYLFIFVGLLFVGVGLVGVFRFQNFYARLLSAADIDTVGLITILIGVAFLSGFSWFTLKVLFIMMVVLIINPIVTSSIAASAYFSGYKLKKDEKDDSR